MQIKLVLVKDEWRCISLKNIFYVTSGLVDMPSLKFQLRISFLFYVGFSHNLVKEIWVVHMTLRSYKISCEIEGHVDLWRQLQGKCIFFLYRLICLFITESILNRFTPNFQVWSLKAKEKYRGMLRGESSGCKGITSSIFFNGDISCTIGLSSNMLKENQIEDLHLYLNMICDIINLVFNKMEETFQFYYSFLFFFTTYLRLSISPLFLNQSRWNLACW